MQTAKESMKTVKKQKYQISEYAGENAPGTNKLHKKTVQGTDLLTKTMIMKFTAFQNAIKINVGWLNVLIVISKILFQN